MQRCRQSDHFLDKYCWNSNIWNQIMQIILEGETFWVLSIENEVLITLFWTMCGKKCNLSLQHLPPIKSCACFFLFVFVVLNYDVSPCTHCNIYCCGVCRLTWCRFFGLFVSAAIAALAASTVHIRKKVISFQCPFTPFLTFKSCERKLKSWWYIPFVFLLELETPFKR